MSQLSPEARRLLNLAHRDDMPDASMQQRVERSLGRRIALGAALTTGSTLIAKTAAGARVWMLAAKIVGVTGAATVVGAGWYVASGSESAPDQQPAPAAPRETKRPAGGVKAVADSEALPPPVVAPAEPAAPLEPRALPAKKAAPEAATPITEAPAVAAFPTSMPPDRLLAETTDLRRAQQALRAGDPSLALRLVREQDQLHAGGALQQERAAVSIFALCESGQVANARSEAARFEERWPESALVARVRASCRDR